MSASESAFSDAEENPVQGRKTTERKRQRSVGEMIKAVEKKKRVISPKQAAQMAKGEKASDFLVELKKVQMAIGSEIAGLWEKIERKFDSFESRIEKLEGEIFVRDKRIDELENEVKSCRTQVTEFEEQLEDMERHSRSANLVLRSMEFGKRNEGEDIRALTVRVLRENFPNISISAADFSAVHRLAAENCVICAFIDRNLRNAIYENRLNLRNRKVDQKKRLYVNESLTKNKMQIFNRLLALKREQKIMSAYTRGGIPIAKIKRESPPTRVHSLQQLDRIERGLAAQPAAGPSVRPAGAGPPFRPAAAAGLPRPGGGRPARAGEAPPPPAVLARPGAGGAVTPLPSGVAPAAVPDRIDSSRGAAVAPDGADSTGSGGDAATGSAPGVPSTAAVTGGPSVVRDAGRRAAGEVSVGDSSAASSDPVAP